MPNGILGLNCRVLNVSRDQILSAVRNLNCAFVLVQDDPDLIAPLKAMGVKTIYRQSGDENLSLSPAQFVQTRAEKGADFVYLTNELDPTPEVLAYTMECMKYADKIGVKCVVFNFATDRSTKQWNDARPCAAYAVQNGHAVGAHVYLPNSANTTAQTWIELKHQLGGLWLVTEYAFYVDAYHGWIGTLNPAEYGAFFRATLPLFEREGMPLLGFSGDDWPLGKDEHGQDRAETGFGMLRSSDLIREIAVLNQTFKWSEKPVTPVIQIPPILGDPLAASVIASNGLNMRATPSVDAPVVVKLPYKALVTEYPANTVVEPPNTFVFIHDTNGNPGWVSQVYLAPVEKPIVFRLHAPFANYKIVSAFNAPRPGYVTDYPGKLALHEGCDFEPTDGSTCDPIVHIGAPCKVIKVDYQPTGYGNYLIVDFGNGFSAVYAHFQELYVKVGQTLIDRQIVGLMGATGSASEPHVHLTLSNPALGADNYVYPKCLDCAPYLA